MPPERLLRIGAAYHLLLGGVFAVFPTDALRFLALEPPQHWLLWYLACAGPLLAGGSLLVAARSPALRPGLLVGVVAGCLSAMVLLIFFVVWSELPGVLYGPAAAAGLWAWLLWGVYSPDP